MCNHELVVKDAFTKDKAVKITICKNCLDVKGVVIHGEKQESDKQNIWDLKDRRMVRMNSLNHATQLVALMYPGSETLVDQTLKIAERIEQWIYRE